MASGLFGSRTELASFPFPFNFPPGLDKQCSNGQPASAWIWSCKASSCSAVVAGVSGRLRSQSMALPFASASNRSLDGRNIELKGEEILRDCKVEVLEPICCGPFGLRVNARSHDDGLVGPFGSPVVMSFGKCERCIKRSNKTRGQLYMWVRVAFDTGVEGARCTPKENQPADDVAGICQTRALSRRHILS